MAAPRSSRRGGARTVVAVLALCVVLCVVFVLALVRSASGPFPVHAWLTGARPEHWPVVERLDLVLDLGAPPRFEASGDVTFADVRERHVPFLLNAGLEVTEARGADGTELDVRHGPGLRSRYHNEGRVVLLDLGREPEPGGERVRVHLAWSGDAEDGSGSRDWRGMLLLAPDEFRMSDQTIFVPSVPLADTGPAKRPARARVQLIVPQGFRAFVAGVDCAPTSAARARPGTEVLCFEQPQPARLNIVAGRKQRFAIDRDGMQLVALMGRHAELGPDLLNEALDVCDFYARSYGAAHGSVLGVCEIECLGDHSYNWAANGVIVFDTAAFRDGVPHATLGHEVAHLWFGQAVSAAGDGERFLTEGLAEYLSWRWLEEREGVAAAERRIARDRTTYLDAVHRAGADPALEHVTFATPAYAALAYGKGALCLRYLEHALGRDVFDERLAAYVAAHAGGSPTLDDFARALAGSVEEAHRLLPWLVRAGHAHLALDDVTFDAATGRLSGSVSAADCPAGAPVVLPGTVELRALAVGSEVDAAVTLDAGGAFELALDTEPDAVLLDPNLTLPVAGRMLVSFSGASLVRSDPEADARDVSYRRRELELELDRPLRELGADDVRDLRAAVRAAAREAGVDAPSIGDVRLEGDGRVLVLELLHALLPDRGVLVKLDGVLTDVHGVPVKDATLRFHTAPSDDDERPTIVATVPAAGSVGVDPAQPQIRIHFSEPMRPGRGYGKQTIRGLASEGWSFPSGLLGDSHWEDEGRELVYDLAGPLAPGTRYALPLRSAFQDLSGNAIEDFDFKFETKAAAAGPAAGGD